MAQKALYSSKPFYKLKKAADWFYEFIVIALPDQPSSLKDKAHSMEELIRLTLPWKDKAYAFFAPEHAVDFVSGGEYFENAVKHLEKAIEQKFKKIRRNSNEKLLGDPSLKEILKEAFSPYLAEQELEGFIQTLASKIIFEKNYGMLAFTGGSRSRPIQRTHFQRERFFDRLQRLSESLEQARLAERSCSLLITKEDRLQALWELADAYWPDRVLGKNGRHEILSTFPKDQTLEERQESLTEKRKAYFLKQIRHKDRYKKSKNREWVEHIKIVLGKAFMEGWEESPWEIIQANLIATIDDFALEELLYSVFEDEPAWLNPGDLIERNMPWQIENEEPSNSSLPCPYDLTRLSTVKQRERFDYVWKKRPTLAAIKRDLGLSRAAWKFSRDTINSKLSDCQISLNPIDDVYEIT